MDAQRPRQVRRFAVLVVALAVLAVAPAGQAHAAPDPLDNEIHLLADGGDDSYALTGGLDLQDLFAREAWHRPRSAEGVIFRMIVYGSAGPANLVSPLRLTLDWEAPAGAGSFALSSPDGLTYTAEGADLVEAGMESEGTAIQGSIQVFVPYEALGAHRGQAVGPFTWRSWVGDDLRDVAPGGRPVPGTQGQVMVPEDSTEILPSLPLEGPRGYTRSTTAADGDGVRIDVQNLITVTGQHILVELPADAAGWQLGEPEPAASSVDPGQHPSFRFRATPGPGAGPLTLHVTTDLGGREAIVLPATGGGGVTSAPTGTAKPGDSGGGGGRDTPGLGPLVALVAVAAVAAGARRTR